jgi:WD40 repeat protein
VVSGSEDRTVKVWDLESGVELVTLNGHEQVIWSVAVTSDGQRVVSGSDDGTLKVWDLESGRELATFIDDGPLHACVVCPDGATIIAGGGTGRVHFLRLENITSGSLIMTAWMASGARDPAFGCPYCHIWSTTPKSSLGRELPCPHCGKPIYLNPFVITTDWQPVAAAWQTSTPPSPP